MACEKFKKGSKAYIACISNLKTEPGEKPVEGGQTTSYSKLGDTAKSIYEMTPLGAAGKAGGAAIKKGIEFYDKRKHESIKKKREY